MMKKTMQRALDAAGLRDVLVSVAYDLNNLARQEKRLTQTR